MRAQCFNAFGEAFDRQTSYKRAQQESQRRQDIQQVEKTQQHHQAPEREQQRRDIRR
ncbi:hypothetical protein [Pontibacter pamirensis]|uniref:hypothetical protein n=1 Tax=Pontibacter pamirensis TaxID=2562824 RepID=UPI001389BC0F|nr:hypothetical protein [Pontibacter pamirensis]